MLTSEGEWTVEERLALESQLVLATAKPLCLDPSPAVSLVQQRLHHRRHALNTPGILIIVIFSLRGQNIGIITYKTQVQNL